MIERSTCQVVERMLLISIDLVGNKTVSLAKAILKSCKDLQATWMRRVDAAFGAAGAMARDEASRGEFTSSFAPRLESGSGTSARRAAVAIQGRAPQRPRAHR